MKSIKNKTEVGGMWGEKVAVTKVNGRLVVTNRPQRKVNDPSEKQIGVKRRFTEATLYAKGQMENEETKALYASGITAKTPSAYVAAMRDYLVAPVVELIDTREYGGSAGDAILVKATDDFRVTRVRIIITDASGNKLEQGEAVQDPIKIFNWTYRATVENPNLPGTKIAATAYDQAGNATSLEKVMVI